MARRKYSAPRRGSLGYVRKRTSRLYPRISSWPQIDDTKLLGFPVYKVGMLSTIEIIEQRTHMFYGKPRSVASTALEAPPIKIVAIRAYQDTPYGLKSIGEIWAPNLDDPIRKNPFEEENQKQSKKTLLDYLRRKITLPKDPTKAFGEEYQNKKRGECEKLIEEGIISEVRALVATRPDLTGIGKKVPEVLEIGVGGPTQEAFNYLTTKLGDYIKVDEVFEVGQFVDIIGVTKGKGFQGVVKRFGVKILPPKTKKEKRAVGSLGPWYPAGVMWTVPRYGQLGYFKRVEYNKQILSIITEGYEKFNPKGGWMHYGIIRNPAVILRGSVQGPVKRIVVLRHTIRPKKSPFKPTIEGFQYSREKIGV